MEWFRPWKCQVGCQQEFSRVAGDAARALIRYQIARPGFRVRQVTLVTTLLDAERYSAGQLAEAYGLRWTIETCFKHLKTTMKMDVLRCQTVAGVLKELTMFLLVYNMVRMTMLMAAERQGVPLERISFVDALRWLATARPGEELRELGGQQAATRANPEPPSASGGRRVPSDETSTR